MIVRSLVVVAIFGLWLWVAWDELAPRALRIERPVTWPDASTVDARSGHGYFGRPERDVGP